MAKSTTQKNDDRQTAACDALRNYVQSIAILAVRAQDAIGNPDLATDMLDAIESDLAKARAQVKILYDYEQAPRSFDPAFDGWTLDRLRERLRLNGLRGIASSKALRDEIAAREKAEAK